MSEIGNAKVTDVKRGNSGLDPKTWDVNKELLDAMRIIARQEINKAPRDITKNALVRSVNNNGTVNVTIEGKEFNNIPNYATGNIKANNIVKVTYPQNQASNMYVSGTVAKNGINALDIYPVGSIYLSVNGTSPTYLFGGTWELLQDRFLLGAGNVYAINSVGGEVNHTLTVNELPTHRHGMGYASMVISSSATTPNQYDTPASNQGFQNSTEAWFSGWYKGTVWETQDYGSSWPHNNMPPYLAVYMWKRTA